MIWTVLIESLSERIEFNLDNKVVSFIEFQTIYLN